MAHDGTVAYPGEASIEATALQIARPVQLGSAGVKPRTPHWFRTMARPLFVPDLFLRRVMRKCGLREEQVQLGDALVNAWVSAPSDKPPLLLLHGFGSDALWQWVKQARALSKHFRLFVPDMLYFGSSTSRDPDFRLEYQVETMLAFMDHHGVERFDALGISFGGLVALDIGSRFEHRLRRLVISDSPGHLWFEHEYQAVLERFGVQSMSELLVPQEPAHIRRLLRVAFHRPPYVPSLFLRDAHGRFFVDHAPHKRQVMDALVARIEDDELNDRTLDVETLLLWGEHDPFFSVDVAKRLRRAIGDHARLHVIPRTAHAPNHEKPREFNRVVLGFLRDS